MFFLQGRSCKSVGFSHLQQRSVTDIASCCVQLLPALCSHLENCHNHFQVQIQLVGFHSWICTHCKVFHLKWEYWKVKKVFKYCESVFMHDWGGKVCKMRQSTLCASYFLQWFHLCIYFSAVWFELLSLLLQWINSARLQLSVKIALCLYTIVHFYPDTAVWKQWHCGWTCHRCSGAPADVIQLPAASASPEHHLQLVRRTSTTDFRNWIL